MDRDALRARVAALMVDKPAMFRGFAASGGRLVPWQETALAKNKTFRQQGQVMGDLHADLPAVKKRTPQERLKEMTDILVKTGVRHGDGSWSFPRSVTRQIQALTGQMGEVVTEATITKYAAHLLTEAEKNLKKTRPEVPMAHS